MVAVNHTTTAPNAKDITGQVIGRWTVLERLPTQRRNGRSRNTYRCQCQCGTVRIVQGGNLLAKKTLSCGCLHRERVSEAFSTHNASGTKVYRVWASMIQRCTNPHDKRYADYGGRGIVVCDRWRCSFEKFLQDMGPRPSRRHSIDRINNNGNYEPVNCRWATPTEQSINTRRNRLVEFGGQYMPLIEACRLTGASYKKTMARLNHGMTFSDAISQTKDTP